MPTSFAQPATGRLDRQPISVHATTRLEEERLLMDRTHGTATTPRGPAARHGLRPRNPDDRGGAMAGSSSPARRVAASRRSCRCSRPMTICVRPRRPSSSPASRASITSGDEQPVTLQHFLDEACRVWECSRPMRVPVWLVPTDGPALRDHRVDSRYSCVVYARLHPARTGLALGRYAPRAPGAHPRAEISDPRLWGSRQLLM